MAKKKDGRRPRFPWRKALRSAAVKGTDAGVKTCIVSSFTGEPTTILSLTGIATGGTAVASFVGDVMNHFLDDPSPVFDARTTTLFDLVGMTVCFFIFVVPSMILDVIVSPEGSTLPGSFGILAFLLSGFLVSILRGLLINLGVVRDEDDEQDRRSGPIAY